MRILLVDDDPLAARPLANALIDQRYIVDVAVDGAQGWEFAEAFAYDLILLDVMLPKLDGISLCRRLRSHNNQTPVMLITAHEDASTTKVSGLDAGADDYVVKPFDLSELLARIRALLRRSPAALSPQLEWQHLQLDPNTCAVSWQQQPIHLTRKEYSLLELFLRNPQRVFSISALMDHLWSFEESPTDDTIRSHMRGLRQKLKKAGVLDDPIETMYGIGYRLKKATAPVLNKLDFAPMPPAGKMQKSTKRSSAEDKKKSSKQAKKDSAAQAQTAAGMALIWEQVKEELDRRITLVEEMAARCIEADRSPKTALKPPPKSKKNDLKQDPNPLDIALQRQQLKQQEKQQEQAEQAAHKLIGSLGMFGCPSGSERAREIERLLKKKHLSAAERDRLQAQVIALRQDYTQMNATQIVQTLTNSEPEPEQGELPTVLMVEADPAWAATLATHAHQWQLQIQLAPTPHAAYAHLKTCTPAAVLLNIDSDESGEALALLADLHQLQPPVPIVVLTEADRLLDRVNLARLGGHTVLTKPIAAEQVLQTLNQRLQQAQSTQGRVLAVDDDPLILAALHHLLTPWGITLQTLSEPLQFLELLKANPPDLLILDVDMPQINGIELCQVVRQNPDWSSLPIVFLTARNDAETRQQIFSSGADDYVSKPIVEAELVTRILNRLERSQLMRHLAETDPLTGIANRRRANQELNRFLTLAIRQQQPFSLALLDLDQFKQVNDRHGHDIGDRVLQAVSQLLKRTFRYEDTIGRWGGEEFVIGLYGTTLDDAIIRITALLETVRDHTLTTPTGDPIQITFSAGVAAYSPGAADLSALYRVADRALHQAKTTGRNQVVASHA
jgi:diguanylate cyclase (GGDEF)-like protein